MTNPGIEIRDENARKAIVCLIGLVAGFFLSLLVIFGILISHVHRIEAIEQRQKGVIIK